MRTRIKICGVMRAEDGLAAARAGADAVGMVFHPPARRNISIDQAQRIVAALPPFITPVGLFVDARAETVLETAQAVGLRCVQLHGQERPEAVAELRGLSVLKAVRVAPEGFAAELERWRRAIIELDLANLAGVVLETAGTVGGSGLANDWSAVAQHQAQGHFAGLPPLIAAGGLTPATVGDVVARIRPWAVDVSSGVESALGSKSAELMEAFVRAARR